MDERQPRSAIETAREYGVDIEPLRFLRSRAPVHRLRLMQSMLRLILKGRESIRRQKELRKRERHTKP